MDKVKVRIYKDTGVLINDVQASSILMAKLFRNIGNFCVVPGKRGNGGCIYIKRKNKTLRL